MSVLRYIVKKIVSKACTFFWTCIFSTMPMSYRHSCVFLKQCISLFSVICSCASRVNFKQQQYNTVEVLGEESGLWYCVTVCRVPL